MINNSNTQNNKYLLDKELKSDEILLWIGTPQQGIKFKFNDFYLIIFSLIFLCFSTFLFIIAPDVLTTILLIFGFYSLVLRYIDDAVFRNNSIYAISNSRIIISYKYFKRKFITIEMKELSNIILKTNKMGIGSIYFGSNIYAYSDFIFPLFKMKVIPHFDLIKDPDSVLNLIKDVLIKANNYDCMINK
jgi:hypothetical protein